MNIIIITWQTRLKYMLKLTADRVTSPLADDTGMSCNTNEFSLAAQVINSLTWHATVRQLLYTFNAGLIITPMLWHILAISENN